METTFFLEICLKNYFQRNGSFDSLRSDSPKLYDKISKIQKKVFENDKGHPNKTQSLMYSIMGFPALEYHGENLCPYFSMLMSPLVKDTLTTKEKTFLRKYINYKNIDVTELDLSPMDLPRFTYQDMKRAYEAFYLHIKDKKWVTSGLIKLLESGECTKKQAVADPELNRKARELLAKNGIVGVDTKEVLAYTFGNFRGVYSATLQLGAYIEDLTVGNITGLSASDLVEDYLYSRYFSQTLEEFWGAELPVFDYEKGYAVYRVFFNQQILYYLVKPKGFVLMDKTTLAITSIAWEDITFDGTAPYYKGELLGSFFKIPSVYREPQFLVRPE